MDCPKRKFAMLSKVLRHMLAAGMVFLRTLAANGQAGYSGMELYSFREFAPKVCYAATSPLEKGSGCELAVVHIHGSSGGAGVSKEAPAMLKALKSALGDGKPQPYVISPLFPSEKTLSRKSVDRSGRAVWSYGRKKSPDGAESVYGDWRGGGDAAGTKFSSYDVVDAVFAALGDETKFPKLKGVVLVGFSAGGQFVGRYVAVGKGIVRKGIVLEYAAMAPSSELYFDKETDWHYGTRNRPRYSAHLTEDDIMKNLSSRRVWRGCGTRDVKTRPHTLLDISPAAMSQGENRYTRFLNFEKYLKRYPSWAKQVTFHSFEGLGHANSRAHSDPAFIKFVIGD
jgi:pimeloyl-ACP methyl ester carboxylesterase